MSNQQTLGNYRILSVLGEGGMGTVYRAVHVIQGQTVALKVLAPHLSRDPAVVGRFWEEYQTVRGLYHHNIVQVYEFGEDRGFYFIAAEYIRGRSLEDVLTASRRLRLRQAVGVVQQIARALDAVHPRGIVHQDLKPSNVLIERGGRVVLTDFGIASIAGGQGGMTQSGDWWGTPAYVSPEQARGDAHVTYQADIYALGVVTYRMLSGRLPFQQEQGLALLYAHIHETPPPLRAVAHGKRIPQAVEQVVMQALQKDPRRRPRRAGDFARQLASAAGVATARGSVPTRLPRERHTPSRQPARTPALLAVGGVLIIGLLIAAVALSGALRTGSSTEDGGRGLEATLAYVSQRGTETRICTRTADGKKEVFVSGSHDWAPDWSPDGRRIAFASERNGGTSIWILDPDSRHASLLDTEGNSDASGPSWSPNGEYIAFDMKAGGDYDIFVQRVGSSSASPLTWHTAQDSDPDWSPDGEHIAFVSDRADDDLEIYVMDAEGENLTRLTRHSGRDFAPVWSPDGRQIAYECADDAGGDIEICVMQGDGSRRRVLTSNAVDDRQPAWSPDGRHIAFCRERSSGALWDIWVMAANGADERVWIQDDHSNTHPAWKP